MSETKLPPLPKPPVNDARGMFDPQHSVRHTPAQMLAYGKACAEAARLQERERAAKVCDAIKTRPPAECSDLERGFNGALRKAAAAIRKGG